MLDINDIVIDPEFEACCPALSEDEQTQLTANIIRDGRIRDALVVWLGRGILVDGHNRLSIWRNACSADPDMTPEIIEKPFKDREEALSWIIRNQLGRRNLTDAQRVALALKLKPELQARAKAKQAAGGADKVRQKSDEPIRVDDQIAKEAGKSRDTVRKVESVLQSGDQQIAQEMLAGKVSINQAAKRVKAANPKPERSTEKPDDRPAAPSNPSRELNLGTRTIRAVEAFQKAIDKIYSTAPAESHKVAASWLRNIAENLETGVFEIDEDGITTVLGKFYRTPTGQVADECRAFLQSLQQIQSDEVNPLPEEQFRTASLAFRASIELFYNRFFTKPEGGGE